MTPQERQMLADLFERIRSTAPNPRDAEAEAFIADAVREQPYAAYILAQTALVQQNALEAAAKRIQELEARTAQAAQPSSSFLGNLGRTLFGGGQPTPPSYDAGGYQRAAAPPQQQPAYAPPQPAYAPPPAGPWSGAQPAAAPRGGGFLANAMTTATGVAGGLLAANAIESLIGGGRGGLFGGGFGGAGLAGPGFGGFGGGETVVNNYYDAPSPEAGMDQAASDPGFQDAADYTDGGFDGGGFDDGSGGGSTDV